MHAAILNILPQSNNTKHLSHRLPPVGRKYDVFLLFFFFLPTKESGFLADTYFRHALPSRFSRPLIISITSRRGEMGAKFMNHDHPDSAKW